MVHRAAPFHYRTCLLILAFTALWPDATTERKVRYVEYATGIMRLGLLTVAPDRMGRVRRELEGRACEIGIND
jgi:hypothetical protein